MDSKYAQAEEATVESEAAGTSITTEPHSADEKEMRVK